MFTTVFDLLMSWMTVEFQSTVKLHGRLAMASRPWSFMVDWKPVKLRASHRRFEINGHSRHLFPMSFRHFQIWCVRMSAVNHWQQGITRYPLGQFSCTAIRFLVWTDNFLPHLRWNTTGWVVHYVLHISVPCRLWLGCSLICKLWSRLQFPPFPTHTCITRKAFFRLLVLLSNPLVLLLTDRLIR